MFMFSFLTIAPGTMDLPSEIIFTLSEENSSEVLFMERASVGHAHFCVYLKMFVHNPPSGKIALQAMEFLSNNDFPLPL